MNRRNLTFAVATLIAVAATGCLPIRAIPAGVPTNQRTGGLALVLPCVIPVSGDAHIAGTNHGVGPYLEEITRLSSIRFVPAPRSEAAERGLVIVDGGPSRSLHGWTTLTTWDVSPREFSRAVVELHDDAPPDAVRHELGHALGFEHARSGVMANPIRDGADRGWSATEREAIRRVGQASGCRR
jgi:hypothetical protein